MAPIQLWHIRCQKQFAADCVLILTTNPIAQHPELTVVTLLTGARPMTKRDKQLLRAVFESWREYTVEIHASRFRKKQALEQRGKLHEFATLEPAT